jgi:hypothetical protein
VVVLDNLRELVCDFFALTPMVGAGVWKSFQSFPVSAGDYNLRDAGYCTPGLSKLGFQTSLIWTAVARWAYHDRV